MAERTASATPNAAKVIAETLEALDEIVGSMALELRAMPRPALLLAAKACAQYRRRGGSKLQVPPDFFIGPAVAAKHRGS
jgi:hypothetical protein